MAIKVDHNAEEVAKDILKFQDKFDKEIRKTFFDTFDVASERVVSQTIPDGAERKGRFNIYLSVRGATIPRRSKRTGRVGRVPIFSKNKIISRSGKFVAVFKNKNNPDIIKEVTRKGNVYTGVYGVRGSQGGKVLAQELKVGRGKPRKPVTKALRFAAKRFLTLLVKNVKDLKL